MFKYSNGNLRILIVRLWWLWFSSRTFYVAVIYTPSRTEFIRRWDELSFVWIIEMICWAWVWVRVHIPYNEIGCCEYWKGWRKELGWYETVEVGWQNRIHFTFMLMLKKQLKNRLVLLRDIQLEISCWIRTITVNSIWVMCHRIHVNRTIKETKSS